MRHHLLFSPCVRQSLLGFPHPFLPMLVCNMKCCWSMLAGMLTPRPACVISLYRSGRKSLARFTDQSFPIPHCYVERGRRMLVRVLTRGRADAVARSVFNPFAAAAPEAENLGQEYVARLFALLVPFDCL